MENKQKKPRIDNSAQMLVRAINYPIGRLISIKEILENPPQRVDKTLPLQAAAAHHSFAERCDSRRG